MDHKTTILVNINNFSYCGVWWWKSLFYARVIRTNTDAGISVWYYHQRRDPR